MIYKQDWLLQVKIMKDTVMSIVALVVVILDKREKEITRLKKIMVHQVDLDKVEMVGGGEH
jgi:hypothetical protein